MSNDDPTMNCSSTARNRASSNSNSSGRIGGLSNQLGQEKVLREILTHVPLSLASAKRLSQYGSN